MAAVGFLILDGMLIGVAGYLTGRPGLFGVAAVAGVAAFLVGVSWRRHRQRLEALQQERSALAKEARAMRDLLRDRMP